LGCRMHGELSEQQFLLATLPPSPGQRRMALGMVLTLFVAFVITAPLRAAQPETRILLLNAADPYLPAYVVIDEAMRETLAQDTTRQFEYFSETLDGQRFDWRKFEPEFLDLLVKKYNGLHIDIVVAITQPALDFVNEHGKELWPDAWVVFHTIPARTFENIALPPRQTGVVTREDIGGTLDLARRLQPDAHRIVFIAGASVIDQHFVELARRAMAARSDQPEVEFLLGLSQSELVDRVKQEAAKTIVVYLSEFRDRDGRPYTPREVLRAISAESPAPVYNIAETQVGFGTVGGIMESYKDRGRLVAEQIRQVAAGTSPSSTLVDVPSRCITDAGALRRCRGKSGRPPSVWR
jgi:hypothetical protein